MSHEESRSGVPAGRQPVAESSTEALVARAIANDPAAIEAIMRMYNQRLFGIAHGVVRDDGMAEDVLQDGQGSAVRESSCESTSTNASGAVLLNAFPFAGRGCERFSNSLGATPGHNR